MKIYTKTGDKGTTSLYGGKKVSKSDIKIDSYGTVDELNSIIGIIRSYSIPEIYIQQLVQIQKDLFNLGAELATPVEKLTLANGKSRLLVTIAENDIAQLEKWIDEIEENLDPLTHFILPGGSLAASQAHFARTVCRRAERITVALAEVENISEYLQKYLNRLSDYLFTLARILAKEEKVEEVKWIPGE